MLDFFKSGSTPLDLNLDSDQVNSGQTHQQMLDLMPYAVIMCDPDFSITYANSKSVETLRGLRHLISIDPDQMIGESIDVFHKNPAHQRGILSDSSRFPFSSVISLGEEKLDLYVQEVRQPNGKLDGFMLTWSVITDKLRLKAEQDRLMQMMNDVPTPMILADRDFNITYMNKASFETFEKLRDHLPVPPEAIVGSSIDVFHKHPEHQRAMLTDPNNLPHRAIIRLGPEYMDLRVSAVRDAEGGYIGPMLTWSLRTGVQALEQEFESSIGEQVENAISMVDRMTQVSRTLSDTARSARSECEDMHRAAVDAVDNIQTVAAATEEMSAAAAEIARQISLSSEKTRATNETAQKTNDTIASLSEATDKIGDVIAIINDIAEQTNLLALNATIEAARAGEAGKGFAVVASEVKTLASQTAQATGDIRDQIATLQDVSRGAASAITEISKSIDELQGVSQSIASAAEEQRCSTDEIARSIQEAANSGGNLQQSVDGVMMQVEAVDSAASDVSEIQKSVQDCNSSMKVSCDKFLQEVKKL